MLANISSALLEKDIFSLPPGSQRESFQDSISKYEFAGDTLYLFFRRPRKFPPISNLQVVLYYAWMWTFIKDYFCIYQNDHMTFPLYLVNAIPLIEEQVQRESSMIVSGTRPAGV